MNLITKYLKIVKIEKKCFVFRFLHFFNKMSLETKQYDIILSHWLRLWQLEMNVNLCKLTLNNRWIPELSKQVFLYSKTPLFWDLKILSFLIGGAKYYPEK